jgi:hypothetical protein
LVVTDPCNYLGHILVRYYEIVVVSTDSKNRKGQQPTARSKRSVCSHKVMEIFEDDYDTSQHEYGVDVTTSEILAFAAQRHQKPRPQFLSGSCMPIGRWKSISDDAQKTWDLLDDGDKAKILALNKKHMERAIDEHRHIASETNDKDVNHTDNGPTSSSEILAMVTQSKPNHPADVRKALSQKKADKITVNGQKYRLANVHHITYDVGLHPGLRNWEPLSIEAPMEALQAWIHGSSQDTHTNTLTLVALITMKLRQF